MVAAGEDEADAQVLMRLRQVVGNVPMVVTLDYHANISQRGCFPGR